MTKMMSLICSLTILKIIKLEVPKKNLQSKKMNNGFDIYWWYFYKSNFYLRQENINASLFFCKPSIRSRTIPRISRLILMFIIQNRV